MVLPILMTVTIVAVFVSCASWMHRRRDD